jgi:fumarate reductase iron-sulfur subunit
MITISIKRYQPSKDPAEYIEELEIEENSTLLEALTKIKTTKDSTLSFRSGCRSSICGSCAVRVNGREELACAYKPKDGDVVEPLRFAPVVKDLIVDQSSSFETLNRAKAWLDTSKKDAVITPEDERRTSTQSSCILCNSCWSACPVYESRPAFIGPFALTRDWRYIADPREESIKSKIDNIQQDGVWDCTLCGECTAVCPQGIDPKSDILMLRTKSTQMGYMDPNMGSFGSFGLDF